MNEKVNVKCGVMQPYLFPYIGYFQLIDHCDTYVILDDVNYINKGWINRNRILVNGSDHLFTIPLEDASQNKLICDISIQKEDKWKSKFIKLIQMSYSKAPQFKIVFPLIEDSISNNENNLSAFIYYAQSAILNYLQIDTRIIKSAGIYQNQNLKGQDRILDICLKENTSNYINPIGGIELYSKEIFEQNNIELHFIKSKSIEYKQFKNEFVPYLSIIDTLMFNDIDGVKNMLTQFELS